MKQTVFGIDLGTTYSCIAHVDEYGRPAVINNMDNDPTTASVVLFESETNHVVGRQAKRQAVVKPEETCSLVKRKMGHPDWTFPAHGKEWSAPAVSSLILAALADDARRVTGEEVRQVVITVPAYFGNERRTATKMAGEPANLDVVDIINEPLAAAFNYGFAQAEAGNHETVLVYDLGGGTFDTTVIQIADQKISTVATEGAHELGGVNWDQLLARHVASRFVDENPDAEDPLDDDHAKQGLMNDVEEQKAALTNRESVELIVVHDGARAGIAVTREHFEEITSGLLEQTIELTRKVIDAATKKGVSHIDRILLVGGSSKMPAVKRRLEEVFGITAELRDPDLAVAKGAALYGRKKLIEGEMMQWLVDAGHAEVGTDGALANVDQSAVQEAVDQTAEKMGISSSEAGALAALTLETICSRGFGAGVLDRLPDGSRGERVHFLCHQNDPLPLKTEKEVYTIRDNQTLVHIAVYEQGGSVESDLPEDNTVIIEGDIADIPPGSPQGTPLTVTMRMDADGTLRLSAYHPAKPTEPLSLEARTRTEEPEKVAEAKGLVSATSRRD